LIKKKINKLIYKSISPFLGKIIDKLFLTNLWRRGVNYYHGFDKNDYIFNKSEFCFIHVPKTGGITLWEYVNKYNLPFYKFMYHKHNPVSLYCPPDNFKYITILRNPIDRVYSHYTMYQEIKDVTSERGLVHFLRINQDARNLYCQYFSGLINENVDERIFNMAFDNLKKFHSVINFNEYNKDIRIFLNNFNISLDEYFHVNDKTVDYQNTYPLASDDEKEIIKKYNYWDIRLYNEFYNMRYKIDK